MPRPSQSAHSCESVDFDKLFCELSTLNASNGNIYETLTTLTTNIVEIQKDFQQLRSKVSSEHDVREAEAQQLADKKSSEASALESRVTELESECSRLQKELEEEQDARRAESAARQRAEERCTQLEGKPPLPERRVSHPASPLHLPPECTPTAPPLSQELDGENDDIIEQASLSHAFYRNAVQKAGIDNQGPPCESANNSGNIRWFNGADDVLSNLYDCPLYSQGHAFSGLESLFQWRKAKVMRDFQAARDIIEAKNAYVAMKIGITIQCDWKWYNVMFDIMLDCARVKAQQCEQFREELKKTGNMLIHENTDNPIWGARARHQCNGMGRVLELIRDEINSGKISPVTSKVTVTSDMETPPPPNPPFSVRSAPPQVPMQYRKRRNQPPNVNPAYGQNYGPKAPRAYGQYARPNPPKHGQSSRSCYQCGELGHIARDCGHQKYIQCDECRGYGHKASVCPSSFGSQPKIYDNVRPNYDYNYGQRSNQNQYHYAY